MSRIRTASSGTGASFSPVWAALLLLLALLPIPFGANRPWAWSAMALWSALALAGWSLAIATGRRSLSWRPALVVPLIAAVLLVGWIFATITPGFGPPNPMWQIASEQLVRPLPGRIAVSVDAALVSLMRLLAYASIFWLSLQYTRDRRRAEFLLVWISWVSLVLALYGLINYFAGGTLLLWYPRWTWGNDVTSTFVNRNHYATFAGLGVLCSFAVGVSAFRAAWRLSDRSQAFLPRSIECLSGRPLVYFVAMVTIGMALLQTHGRMGAAATSIAFLVMIALMMVFGLVRRHYALWIAILALGGFLFWTSGGITIERLSENTNVSRLAIFETVADQITSAPYTGSGYGSFAQTFMMYRDMRLPAPVIFTAAHNSYLELAAEIGVPATAILLFALLWCLGLCVVSLFRRRRDLVYPIVALSASILVGVHALVDFSLQIPAVACLYAAILGLGVAQSWSSDNDA